MTKNTHLNSKDSADKRTLNAGQDGIVPGEPGGSPKKQLDRRQMQETRQQGQFTGRARPGLQKR